MHIHILGICGTFMGSLAVLAKESGHHVTGSDINCYPPISDQLDEMGIDVIPNYDVDQLKLSPDLIVIGNVMTRDTEIIEYILNHGLTYTSGPEWLGKNILANRRVISVAGTHGKTTTSSIIASALKELGEDPGYLIGGVPINFEASASLGSSPYFVIEADEFDRSLLRLKPDIAVISSIDSDHLDIYSDHNDIVSTFIEFGKGIKNSGTLIYQSDTGPFDSLKCNKMNYSTKHQASAMAKSIKIKDGSYIIDIEIRDLLIRDIKINVPGLHNIENALAASSIVLGRALTHLPSSLVRPRVNSIHPDTGCSLNALKLELDGSPDLITSARPEPTTFSEWGVWRCRVSVTMFSGLTWVPNNLLATSATASLRACNVPSLAIVADVPTHRTFGFNRSLTRRTSIATSAP